MQEAARGLFGAMPFEIEIRGTPDNESKTIFQYRRGKFVFHPKFKTVLALARIKSDPSSL